MEDKEKVILDNPSVEEAFKATFENLKAGKETVIKGDDKAKEADAMKELSGENQQHRDSEKFKKILRWILTIDAGIYGLFLIGLVVSFGSLILVSDVSFSTITNLLNRFSIVFIYITGVFAILYFTICIVASVVFFIIELGKTLIRRYSIGKAAKKINAVIQEKCKRNNKFEHSDAFVLFKSKTITSCFDLGLDEFNINSFMEDLNYYNYIIDGMRIKDMKYIKMVEDAYLYIKGLGQEQKKQIEDEITTEVIHRMREVKANTFNKE